MERYNLNNGYKKQLFLEAVDRYIKEGITVLLKPIKPRRTINQNSLYWVWMNCLQVENGIDRTHTHLLFRAMFLPKPDEKIVKIIYLDLWVKVKDKINSFQYFKGLEDIINIISESTTDQDTKQMSEFMGKIQDYCNVNMGIKLLSLKDIAFNDFYNEYAYK